jgi:transglutaminase-like putative cysteine protease
MKTYRVTWYVLTMALLGIGLLSLSMASPASHASPNVSQAPVASSPMAELTEEDRKLYLRPRETEWATPLAAQIMKGITDDQTRLVVLNRAIAARIEHLSEHPGVLTSEEIWTLRSGWCDNVARLFVTLARAAGYPARVINLHHVDAENGHVAAEAYYHGRWHLFDPDHGVEYYLKDGTVASFADLQKDQTPVLAEKLPWRSKTGVGMEGFFQLPMTIAYWE